MQTWKRILRRSTQSDPWRSQTVPGGIRPAVIRIFLKNLYFNFTLSKFFWSNITFMPSSSLAFQLIEALVALITTQSSTSPSHTQSSYGNLPKNMDACRLPSFFSFHQLRYQYPSSKNVILPSNPLNCRTTFFLHLIVHGGPAHVHRYQFLLVWPQYRMVSLFESLLYCCFYFI